MKNKITFVLFILLCIGCKNNKIEYEKGRLRDLEIYAKKTSKTSSICLKKVDYVLLFSTTENDRITQLGLSHWDSKTFNRVEDWGLINDSTNQLLSRIHIGTLPKGYREYIKFKEINIGNNYYISYKTLYEHGLIFFDITPNGLSNVWTALPMRCDNGD